VLPGFLVDLDFQMVLNYQFHRRVQPLLDFPGSPAHRMVLKAPVARLGLYYPEPLQDQRYHWPPEDQPDQQIQCIR